EARLTQMLENYRFFGAPHVAVITSDAGLGTYGAVDCGGYVATFLAAASSLGVATCAQAALALYSDGVREHLGIGEDRLIVCG
ncbi:nitroreductase family protein, partial [Mycobacterium tuberculosis]|nr:nitroreductase family protein [Mycobacterium tuberculosis]